MLDLLLPLWMLGVSLWTLAKKQELYPALLKGGKEGLRLCFSIAPALVVLLTAVHMLRASGAIDLLTRWLSPVSRALGIPVETLPLMLIRPFSGSAALAVGADLMETYGTDSLIGRTAAVMLGSSETTFYTISVYFGSVGIKKTRYAIPAALIADLVGFFMASLTVKFFLPKII